jgi:alginate O-acetyltransferase complex protein AlgF
MMLRASLVLTLGLIAIPALAQDGQLYEDPADPNASFVRIVAPGESVAVVNGVTFENLDGGVTPFLMMQAGPATAAVGSLQAEGEIAPAAFYTFAVGTDGVLHQLQDQITNSPAKADLVFYNLSDLPLVDLFVPAVNSMALEGITPNTSRLVTLKAPLTLDFQVQQAGVVLASLTGIEMRRRAGVTVVFSGTGGTYTAFAAENLYAN